MVDIRDMSTFLQKTRDRVSFEEKIRTKAVSTQKASRSSIRNFELFCKERHNRTVDDTISEYRKVEMELVYDSLQDWINWNSNRIYANSIPTLFSHLKAYLRYHGIKIAKEDVAEQLNFPHRIKEERHPLSREEIMMILAASDKNNAIKILAQSSSGLRRGELLQLRKKDLDTTQERIMVNVPASITKTKKSRVTFLAKR